MGMIADFFVIILIILLVVTLILVVALIAYAVILTVQLRRIATSVQKAKLNIGAIITQKFRAATPLLVIDMISRIVNRRKRYKKKESDSNAKED